MGGKKRQLNDYIDALSERMRKREEQELEKGGVEKEGLNGDVWVNEREKTAQQQKKLDNEIMKMEMMRQKQLKWELKNDIVIKGLDVREDI